jgi:hypothetical protein
LQGDSKLTGDVVAAAVLQRNATAAIVQVQRVVAPVHVTFVVAVLRAKERNPARKLLGISSLILSTV